MSFRPNTTNTEFADSGPLGTMLGEYLPHWMVFLQGRKKAVCQTVSQLRCQGSQEEQGPYAESPRFRALGWR